MQFWNKKHNLSLEDVDYDEMYGQQMLSQTYKLADNIQGQVYASQSNITSGGFGMRFNDPDEKINYVQFLFDY